MSNKKKKKEDKEAERKKRVVKDNMEIRSIVTVLPKSTTTNMRHNVATATDDGDSNQK